MTVCYFCNDEQVEFYFGYFCEECSNLRRLLLINSPKKCISILKSVLLRNDTQISNKIKQEIHKIEKDNGDDRVDYISKPYTRGSKQIPK
tara:strand:- start:1886 stop:2155 length:270 start_codon:yes stop_codon:yes gene_type:complete